MTDGRYDAADPAGSGNYPLNCWYVVATSDEVGRSLLARQALGRRLLLFRQENGQVAVLDDRCAHRAAPLSMGTLDGDQVVCGYHGFTFAADGRCVRVPSQRHVPYGAQVRSYPVRGAAAVRLGLARQSGAEPRDRAARPARAAGVRLDDTGRLAGDGRQLHAVA